MEKWRVNTGQKRLTKEYKAYNDLYNEGAEGYVPHTIQKWETVYQTTEKTNILGKMYTVAEAEETLKKVIASVPKWMDKGDNGKTQNCIDWIQVAIAALEEVVA